MEPERKRRHVELSEDRQEMLAAFEELWAARKCSSQRPSAHLGPPLVPLSAAGVGPLTPPGSPPSFQSAASS